MQQACSTCQRHADCTLMSYHMQCKPQCSMVWLVACLALTGGNSRDQA